MILFIYDHTFEGLLTCIFDAYFRKTFPDLLLMEGEPLPLFYNGAIHIATDEEKAGRVWRGLQKKISKHALFMPDLLLVIRITKGGRNAFPLYPEGHKLSSFHRNQLCRS